MSLGTLLGRVQLGWTDYVCEVRIKDGEIPENLEQFVRDYALGNQKLRLSRFKTFMHKNRLEARISFKVRDRLDYARFTLDLGEKFPDIILKYIRGNG